MHVSQSRNCFEETDGRNMVIKGNSGQGSERSKESCEESFCGLRENNYHMNRMLVEIWRIRVCVLFFLVQVSDRNEERGGKAILVIKWQRTWLNCVLVFCGK